MLRQHVKKEKRERSKSDELRLRALENSYIKKKYNPEKIKVILDDNAALEREIAQLRKQKNLLSMKIKQINKNLKQAYLEISNKNSTIDTLILLGNTEENYKSDIRRLKKIHDKLEEKILHLQEYLQNK